MKKKIIAVLLTGAMLLGNAGMVSAAAPEAGLEMPEMTEEFSDFGDSAEVFDDGGMEEFDEIAAEEEPFADQPVFEDEKELPVVEDAQIQIAGAGEGVTAPTSVWREGASFGRQKELVKLKGAGTSTQSYWGNWASPETTGFYRDDAGEMHIVTFDGESGKLIEGTCRNSEIVSLKEIKLPLPKWGGFYAAPDGYFYVAVGQDNLEESNTKIVVKILKYDRSWKLLGCADVPGGTANAFPGIYIPFDAASLRMTLIGNTLVVHTGREMFGMEGVHHQSNITFVVDTENMQLINSDIPYTSHSFNQFVVNDGNGVYYLDHGDAFDRGLILSRFSAYGNGYFTGGASFNIFPFMGTIGNNYTGCEVTGFALEGETLMILGKSVPHNFPVSGVTGDDYELNQNVFLILTDKNTGNTTFQWLTDYAPMESE